MRAVVTAALIALTVAGCSSTRSTKAGGTAQPSPRGSAASGSPAPGSQKPAPVENNPPGDIPDNIAYVKYRNRTGSYTFEHPEGWASNERGTTVTFTDKLNGVTASIGAASGPPTVASANQTDVPALRSSQPAFELGKVSATKLPGGSGVLIVYRRNSAPDPVTGKVFRDEVQRYEIYANGHEVVLELFGAVGSDNVDPYTKMSQSLRLS